MTETTASRDRMIAAAAALFARAGFHGVTTRDIARSANVSEGNIFRYFPSKRDLFMSVIDHELGKLQARAYRLQPEPGGESSQAAMRKLLELITQTVIEEPGLVRLLHFSALEFGAEMGPVYRKHLDAIAAASAVNLEQWSRNPGLRNLGPRVTVLSFAATVVLLQLYPVLIGAPLPVASLEGGAALFAELWSQVLCAAPAAELDSSTGLPAGALGN